MLSGVMEYRSHGEMEKIIAVPELWLKIAV